MVQRVWSLCVMLVLFAGAAAAQVNLPPAPSPASASPTCTMFRPMPEMVTSLDTFGVLFGDLASLRIVRVSLNTTATLTEGPCDADWGGAQPTMMVSIGGRADDIRRNGLEHFADTLLRMKADLYETENMHLESAREVRFDDTGGVEIIGTGRSTRSRLNTFDYIALKFYGELSIVVSARGAATQREAALARFRRVTNATRPRTTYQRMTQETFAAFDDALMRLRAPIVDRAIDACIQGEYTASAAIQRANASGWPAFESISQDGETWRTAEAPVDDASAKIRIMVMEIPSQLQPTQRALRCLISASPALEPVLRARLDARIGGTGDARRFTVSDGRVQAGTPGSTVVIGSGGAIGLAELSRTPGYVAIRLDVIPTR